MVMVVGSMNVEETISELREAGETVTVVWRVTERKEGGCVLRNLTSWD